VFDKVKPRFVVAGAVAAVAVAGVATAVAGGADGPKATPAQAPPPLPQGGQAVTLDPANFTTTIDNPYFPLAPGSRWVYRATTPDGEVQRIVVTVTRRTRTVAGVKVRVVHDVATTPKGRKVEDTHDWYAQDLQGNVWYLGEATTAFEHGRRSTEGSWTAGVKGAQPGIAMPANPVAGLAYRQEYYAGKAEDNGQILGLGERVTVPKGRYKDVVTTRDTTSLDSYDVEYKYFARGIGQVLALGVAGDPDREELVSFKRGAG